MLVYCDEPQHRIKWTLVHAQRSFKSAGQSELGMRGLAPFWSPPWMVRYVTELLRPQLVQRGCNKDTVSTHLAYLLFLD